MAPIPKRSDQRIRRNKVAPVSKIHADGVVSVPELGIDGPDPLVEELWVAQHQSAQRQYMESSDWAHFKLALRLLDGQLKAGRFNANLVQVIESIFANHGLAEGHRRKLRIEVERAQEEVAKPVGASASYKRVFGMEAC
jgi:hypothetical protein